MKQLERLLVMQGRRCFFCDEAIPTGEASVEHLVASANGGSNDDENCVVCCKTLNAAFGSKPYKEKLRAVLSHRGKFVCPRSAAGLAAVGPSAETAENDDAQIALVIADLARRGASKPRKEKTLRNTIAAVFQKKLAEGEISELMDRLQHCNHLSIAEDGKVRYKLPGSDV
jgi:hypothetical protein